MELINIFEEGPLKIEIEESAFMVKMSWIGSCSMKNPSLFLDPIINDIYEKSWKQAKQIVFDFTKSRYMNSSAIIPIIKILKIVRDSRGSVQVHYLKSEKWQQTLLSELKIFETPDKRIRIKGV
jgi:hypothetical protein